VKLARWILVLPAAVAATATVICLNSLFHEFARLTIPFPIFCSLAALAWVFCGTITAPSKHFHTSVALFLLGATVIWFMVGGPEVWPYGLWLWLVGAFAGGGIAVGVVALLYDRDRTAVRLIEAAVLVAAVITLTFLYSYLDAIRNDHAAGSSGILFTKDIHGTDRKTDLHFVWDNLGYSLWIWAKDTSTPWYADLVRNTDVSFEWDVGSGASPMRAHIIEGHEDDSRVAGLINAYQNGLSRTWIPIPKTDLSKRKLVHLEYRNSNSKSNQQDQAAN
jgi:hypothetical protein